MSWFEEQIKIRKQSDENAMRDVIRQMADVVMNSNEFARLRDAGIIVRNEVESVLRFYHIDTKELPDNLTDVNEMLSYLSDELG